MKLIENWRDGWRFYSTWAFAALLIAPDAYTALQTLGLMADGALPQPAVWLVRGLALAGVAARFLQQAKPKDKP